MLNYGLKAMHPGSADNLPHVLGFQTARTTAGDTLLEIWNGSTSAAKKFAVDLDGGVSLDGGLNFTGTAAIEEDGTERGRVSGGVLSWGTANDIGAAAGEVVLANAKALRAVNPDGSDTVALLQLDSSGSAQVGAPVGINGLAGLLLGIFSSGGLDAGNGAVQATSAPPSGATRALIVVQGDRYNGVEGTHTGYWVGLWRQSNNQISTLFDVNNGAGTAQGFAVTWTGGALQIANKTGMTANQSGLTLIQYYS